MLGFKEIRIVIISSFFFLGIRAVPFYLIFDKFAGSVTASKYLGEVFRELVLIVVGYYFIRRAGLSGLAGTSFIRFDNRYLIITPLILIGGLFFITIGPGLQGANPYMALLFFTRCILVGISEELLCRGIVQSLLLRRVFEQSGAVRLSVIYSALFFSGMHLVNTIKLGGIPIDQLVYSFFLGVYLASLLLLTGQLLPIGIFHGMLNFLFMFNHIVPGFEKAPIVLEKPFLEQLLSFLLITAFFSPFLLIGIWQMKKIKKENLRPLLKD